MELIKTYGRSNQLNHWKYDKNDKDHFVKNFCAIDEDLADRLCKYLAAENKTVDVEECFDGASCWSGYHFIVDGKDLSLNGYCFSEIELDYFLKSKGF